MFRGFTLIAATAHRSSRPRTTARKARAACGTPSRRPSTKPRRANDTWKHDGYLYNSEDFALDGVKRYWVYWSNRISNTDPAHSRWSAYCSIYFTDEDADGRQDSTEVCRVSGKVDAMRLPKEIYFAYRVIQNPQPDLHILGHWTYPATQPDGTKTSKTVYVIANTQSVELFLNGKSLGRQLQAGQWLDLRLPRGRFCPRHTQGRRQERQGRRSAGIDHGWPGSRHQV